MKYIGFRPLRAGRIHLFCPSCGRKVSNTPRTEYDPPSAVLVHLPCERCSAGCKVEGESKWLDAQGRSIYWEGPEPNDYSKPVREWRGRASEEGSR